MLKSGLVEAPFMYLGCEKQLAVPHNNLIPDSSFFYFVHSYCCLSSEDALTETEHGENFISYLAKDNIFAVQFHPEKSQTVGLDLYKNFLDWSI